MELSGIMDRILYKLVRSSLDDRLIECTYATRTKIEDVSTDNILKFDKFNSIISEFIDIFEDTFTEEQTKAMLYRLKRLSITEERSEIPPLAQIISLGFYHTEKNNITIHYYDKKIPINIEDTLKHELMHMASTRSTKVGLITGLEIPDLIGEGLNEGYTQYLTDKYFKTKTHYTESEDYNVFFAKGIENIVGSEFMQECFFEANLGRLIGELSQYAPTEDIYKLLFLIDRRNELVPTSRNNIRKITKAIADMNERKLKYLLETGYITQREYDIEHAIKVEEYKKYKLWSEECELVQDGDCFLLKERNRQSGLYEFTPPKETASKYEKK